LQQGNEGIGLSFDGYRGDALGSAEDIDRPIKLLVKRSD
jgi:hypothetical protein